MHQPIQISLREARRGILAWQGLYPPRSRAGKQGAKSLLQRVRSIQFDPINVVGRNPDLVLQSRVRDFRPSLLDELLYKERFLVDGWDKMASLNLAEDWPYFSRYRTRMEDMFGVPSEVVMSLAPTVLKQIEREGPQSSLDFDIEAKTDWAWGPTRVTRASLEGLFKMGRLGVHHRVNNRRYFDLIENLLPEELLGSEDPNQDLEAYQHWHVLRRIRAMGLAHGNAGVQWAGIIGVKSPTRRKILDDLTKTGEIVVIEIDELPGEVFYLDREQSRLYQKTLDDQSDIAAAFIAPLDNLLWDRKNLERIFDFNYVWEVYKPKKQREYGYYVLPVLYGEKFVGRLDPSFDKKTGLFTLHNWWWEKGVKVDQAMATALKNCLKEFLVYLDAQDFDYPTTLLEQGNLEWLQKV
jgi:uncharacterized protein YcaQ